MYTIYIPKRQREKEEHEITKVIRTYLKLRPDTSGVICFPGYMSRNQWIEEYWHGLFDNYLKSELYVSFSQGMSGEDIKRQNIQYIMENPIHNLKYLDLAIPNLRDHSKVMLFYKKNSDISLYELCNKEDCPTSENPLETFIKNCDVEAALLGSSNQSFSTYFKPATYGETDIMLIACDHDNNTGCSDSDTVFINDVRRDTPYNSVDFNMKNCVVAKSINFTTDDEGKSFLKGIAMDLLGIKQSEVIDDSSQR